MKLIQAELETYQEFKDKYLSAYPIFTEDQKKQVDHAIAEIRALRTQRPIVHFLLEALPLVLLIAGFVFNLIGTPTLFDSPLASTLFVGVIHGALGYSFIVYTLHEGAGHGVFRKYKMLNRLVFNLPRLRFADPEYYREFHTTHHNYLGTERDGSFSHYVAPKRIIRSLLPGSGILYKNDYQVHQNPKMTKSRIISESIGLVTLTLEVALLMKKLGLGLSLLALLGISPWVGMILDRLRESLEHRYMPADRHFGSRELGLGPIGLLIGGGPWGQPCHLSHHFAPDLQWYGQILLHRKLKGLMTDKQKKFYFFSLDQLPTLFKGEANA